MTEFNLGLYSFPKAHREHVPTLGLMLYAFTMPLYLLLWELLAVRCGVVLTHGVARTVWRGLTLPPFAPRPPPPARGRSARGWSKASAPV